MKDKIILEFKKNVNIRSTRIQLEIIEEICRNPHFGDVKVLWKNLYERNGVSIATVYRTVSLLVNMGFIRREKRNMGYYYFLNTLTL